MKNAAKSMRDIAERKVAEFLRGHDASLEHVADDIVDLVLELLHEPDRVMLDAGRAELVLALPTSATIEYQRNLVAAVWRSMMHRADR